MSIQNQERADPLKHIAGLIQKLSYRDMKTLGAIIVSNSGCASADSLEKDAAAVTVTLLKATDEILAGPGRATDGPVMRGSTAFVNRSFER